MWGWPGAPGHVVGASCQYAGPKHLCLCCFLSWGCYSTHPAPVQAPPAPLLQHAVLSSRKPSGAPSGSSHLRPSRRCDCEWPCPSQSEDSRGTELAQRPRGRERGTERAKAAGPLLLAEGCHAGSRMTGRDKVLPLHGNRPAELTVYQASSSACPSSSSGLRAW